MTLLKGICYACFCIYQTNSIVSSSLPLTFSTLSWSTAQTVTISGVDDIIIDGNQMYMITCTSTSSDTSYSGLHAQFIVFVSLEFQQINMLDDKRR